VLFFFGWEDCGQIPFQVDVIEVREQRNLCAEGRLQRRLGSTAALTSPKADFRSLPKSGLKSAIAVGLFRADSVAKVESCNGPIFSRKSEAQRGR
jgi:hypothetical protein